MEKPFARLACFAFFAALVSACGPRGGTDVGNGATVSFNLKGYEPPSGVGGGSQAQAIVLASGVSIEQVWVAVESFQLRPFEACNGGPAEGEIDFAGPTTANLLESGVVGAKPMFEVPAGDYCRLRLNLHKIKLAELPVGAPLELAENSFLIAGRRADGVTFSAVTDTKVDYRLDAKDGAFQVVAGDDSFIVGFDLAALVAALDLDSFPGPSIVIDKQASPSVVAQLDSSLRASAKLFRDENRDGDLSPSESDDDKQLAEDPGL